MTEATWVTVKSSRAGAPASAVCYQSVIWSGIKSSEKQNDKPPISETPCAKSTLAPNPKWPLKLRATVIKTCCHRTHLAQCLSPQNCRLKINPGGINCQVMPTPPHPNTNKRKKMSSNGEGGNGDMWGREREMKGWEERRMRLGGYNVKD